MEPKITPCNPFILAGIIATGENEGDIDIGSLWERFIAQGEEIQHQVNPDIGYELHIHIDEEPSRHISLIGVEVTILETMPLEMVAMVVPGGTYARFTHLFKNGGYGDAFKTAYAWIENSDYEPANPFDIQVYDERFNGPDDPESVLEILIPVKGK